jgi:hypothetical protein
MKVVGGKSVPLTTTIRVPRPMRVRLQEVLDEDGRKLAEFTRALWGQAISDRRKQKATAAATAV